MHFADVQQGTLYLVATPIGNLGDITLRALHTLRNVDVIFCEDTRVSNHLLKVYGIQASLHAYHDHSNASERHHILKRLKEGQSVALLSDAGTPLISDPGYKVVVDCYEENIPVTLVPGACALIHGLVISGLPPDQFYFGGFLPLKDKDRREKLRMLSCLPASLIFYETGPKLLKTLLDLNEFFEDRLLAVTRELTKKFEAVHRGKVSELLTHYTQKGPPKGELVLVLQGQTGSQEHPPLNRDLCKKMLEKMSVKDTADILSHLFGQSKNSIYQDLLKIKNED
ncbi:MAG: 16S rRNA (cytidine(1402)-2'-O)-methyltransferase [Alphaproteobacteria bacterium RIFCSPLOWO2_01_FULL_45_8]|nr:MAG: 16S rRNA (cytidine(1402)-2'-O)-methyltransferase [Alphaproteobacteria bacterium GWB1_45_5]OFW76424.1 MAG: 16S rRNA (cytidine(1402)-2'-O)-methyltransferase [Alphaproteobacteria bacterium GWA1_45_9]OFW90091.1 MAG: 16S rRNA (cytidine(1402)-2'-O)-methyltransferase [Alphaproteobacteria bacterium RIFCSPHIGHO2_01_FULL_41_14]OFW96370.1 MAG: 16S rRNA (cytidine(1402)-2'-O)-methyltransferase [Alphaproteobacteria bacterium RIFCSPLOWO2_01_FULL_45_8]